MSSLPVIWIWLLLTALLLFVGFSIWGSRPVVYRRRLQDAADMVEMLRTSGAGSVLLLRHLTSDRFLQLAQHSDILGVSDLLFGFPDSAWSKDYFPEVRRRLEANGTDFEIVETGDPHTQRFLQVRVVGNSDDVTSHAIDLLCAAAKGMGLDDEAQFKVHVEGPHDFGQWAWKNRTLLRNQQARGGVVGRVAGWCLRSLDGRKVDPEARTDVEM